MRTSPSCGRGCTTSTGESMQPFAGLAPTTACSSPSGVEGVASVAHAIAYCEAIERLDGAAMPRSAA